ncbi:hypothetical protein [Colwellia sp. MB3u-55]|uniref:hypothetical protein n=1 Tax=Colwellia sp. MB3u-55 TaxID=2759810 RepID=UPI0015F70204|nr:hypothetical protein [Colwellia sp. MB3u-55]MBA6251828.1 hypothetical protein [Colwellia sp. MB3u-55]
MENSKTRASISFRFNRLDKMQAFTLEREILGSLYDKNVENNVYVVCVPLTDTNFDDISDYYVRQRVNIEDCDIFVSVSSDSGTKCFDIPVIVNRMLKYIDCKLTFAFTVL